MLHGCQVANEGEREVALRRCSGFHELFETALNKEREMKSNPKTDPTPALSSWLNPNREDPFADLKSGLRDIVVACSNDPSRKWTWGVDLTEADLALLTRGADRLWPEDPHSGYDTALETIRLSTSSSYSIDPSKIEDPDTFQPLVEDVSPDIPTIPDLADHQHPPQFEFSILDTSGNSIASFQPDSVIRAFSARAIAIRTQRKLKKQALQQEVDEPEADADSNSIAHPNTHRIPRRPWLGPPLAAFSSPTSIESPTADLAMDCNIPDDVYIPPTDDSHVEMVGEMTEAALMDIWQDEASAIAESESDSRQDEESAIAESDLDIWQDEASAIPESDSDSQIPDSFFVLNSDDDNFDTSNEILASFPVDRDVQQSNTAASSASASIIPRDPLTGRFTEDSFTRFLDSFME
jgi:hypothetical protein